MLADGFVMRHHSVRKLRRSYQDAARGVWCVEFAVGKDEKGKASVCMDAESGEVVEYDSSV